MKETDWKLDKIGLQVKETGQQLGGMAYNQGRFAEEYFINSFEKGKRNFFGEKFDSIRKNEKAGLNAVIENEYDILLINGETVGIVEIKFKAHENNIPKKKKKADTFRANYPKFKNKADPVSIITAFNGMERRHIIVFWVSTISSAFCRKNRPK
jgi:hypothetical protein